MDLDKAIETLEKQIAYARTMEDLNKVNQYEGGLKGALKSVGRKFSQLFNRSITNQQSYFNKQMVESMQLLVDVCRSLNQFENKRFDILDGYDQQFMKLSNKIIALEDSERRNDDK